MASGGRRGAGDRVLESKHVIGLFLLMLLFSGIFFSLGYVMGRNQYDVQASLATRGGHFGEPVVMAKSDPAPKKIVQAQPADTSSDSDPATASPAPGWEFSGTSKPAKNEPRLEPTPKSPAAMPASKTVNARSHVEPPAAPVTKSTRMVSNAPLIPAGALVLQVAALRTQQDALTIASSLQRQHFAAYVQPPQKDKFYRVQVGPFRDQKAAEAAKKGLESAGFKAFYVKH